MSLNLHHCLGLSVNRDGVFGRRDFLKGISAATRRRHAELDRPGHRASRELRSRGMACILLWMQGGPSQFETFSPKPGNANGGETKAIDTAVPGIQIAENFPELAKQATTWPSSAR